MEILFIFLVLENILEQYIPFLSTFDEIITIIAFGLLMLDFVQHKIKMHKYYVYIMLCFLATIIIGIAGTLVFALQSSTVAIMKDILAISKFFVVYIYSAYVMKKGISKKKAKRICNFSKVYIVILLVFGILSQFLDLPMNTGYRGSINTFAFLYSHTTFMVASVVVCCSVLVADGIKKNKWYILCSFVILILSVRTKAFVYIISVTALFLLVSGYKKGLDTKFLNRKYKRRIIVSGGIITMLAVYVGKDKISDYLMWGVMAARPALYIVGFRLLKDYFPLGTGFATFASNLSGEYYSPVYAKYGIQNVTGLQLSEGFKYISDTYWPYIIGQFGVFGTIFYIAAMYFVLKNIVRMFRKNLDSLIAALSLYIYIIAGCFVESMLTNAAIVLVAFAFGYYLNFNYFSESEE